ncbi:hypothetical protein BBJ28_00013391 [Nothophytophthora sp. Chile5]|nr:hypothetical protein BBJ28_00013391 [Nothophytophthora sp. Chile5]
MLECTTCGAVGEASFSTNYFGELVCELCGTQSFLQARNETQDVEDTTMDPMRVGTSLKRTRTRSQRVRSSAKDRDANAAAGGKKRRRRRTELSDCLIATQTVLNAQVQALVDRVGPQTFPVDDYPRVVRDLWFELLETWGAKGDRPLLRCFTEFYLSFGTGVNSHEDDALDPAITSDLLEQWDADREKLEVQQAQEGEEEASREEAETAERPQQTEDDGEEDKQSTRSKKRRQQQPTGQRRVRLRDHSRKLDKFSILDLLGIHMLASRVLNLGLLPSDFAGWVVSGVLPFHNLLATCCADAPEIRDAVAEVAMFFESALTRHKASTARIAYHAHHLQHHMELRLPPLNVPLAAHRICRVLGLPSDVFRNFQWITGLVNAPGTRLERPLLLLPAGRGLNKQEAEAEALLASGVGIVAHLAVAIRMSANWHEWVFEHLPATKSRAEEDQAPPAKAVYEPRLLPRRSLEAFTKFCEQALVNPERSGVPAGFEGHIEYLQRLQTVSDLLAREHDASARSLRPHALQAYPAVHIDGILAESDEEIEQRLARLRDVESGGGAEQEGADDPVYFYPMYTGSNRRGALHSAFENVLELLCQHVDTPIATVLPLVRELDKRMQLLCRYFVHKETGYLQMMETIAAKKAQGDLTSRVLAAASEPIAAVPGGEPREKKVEKGGDREETKQETSGAL